MRKFLVLLICCAVTTGTALIDTSHAALLTFKGDGVDLPTSITMNTSCSPSDVCGTSLTYDAGAAGNLVVTATANGVGGQLVIQDIDPTNSGLGVFSEAGQGIYTPSIRSFDEIDANAGEAITLTFDTTVAVSAFELNNGTDQDCPAIGIEGGCGSIEIFVDGISAGIFNAIAQLNQTFVGTAFTFKAVDGSFHLASLDVTIPTPLPAAALFMGTGLVILARRRKTAV